MLGVSGYVSGIRRQCTTDQVLVGDQLEALPAVEMGNQLSWLYEEAQPGDRLERLNVWMFMQ